MVQQAPDLENTEGMTPNFRNVLVTLKEILESEECRDLSRQLIAAFISPHAAREKVLQVLSQAKAGAA